MPFIAGSSAPDLATFQVEKQASLKVIWNNPEPVSSLQSEKEPPHLELLERPEVKEKPAACTKNPHITHSSDPIPFDGVVAKNNPVSYRDPYGLFRYDHLIDRNRQTSQHLLRRAKTIEHIKRRSGGPSETIPRRLPPM